MKTDRRVERTRRALRDALVALILERGWDGFGVQELCDRADVARSTFYMHFADKEELVGGSFDDLKKAIRAQLAAAGASEPLAFARGLIDHTHEQRRLFTAIVGKKSGQYVQRRFREVVLSLVREDLAELMDPGPERDARAAFLTGGFIELLVWSLEARPSPGPETVEALYRELALPALG